MMPQSSQILYIHLGMNADDDGFCEHFTIMRMTGSVPDDLKILQAKKFVKVFDEMVLVILDWKENNNLRADRYTPSKYLEMYKDQLSLLSEGEIIGIPEDIQTVNPVKYSIDKVSIVKNSKEKSKTDTLINDSFDIFWDLYNHRVNKSKSLKEWKKLKPDLHQVIFDHVRKYRESKLGKEFPYHPNNYLKDEHWNDELSTKDPAKMTYEENLKRFEEMEAEL